MANKENKKKSKAWKQAQPPPKQKHQELVESLPDCNVYYDGKHFESVSKK